MDLEIMFECNENEMAELQKMLGYRHRRNDIRRTFVAHKPLTIGVIPGSAIANLTPLENVIDLSLWRSGIAIYMLPVQQSSHKLDYKLSRITDIKRFSVEGIHYSLDASYTAFYFKIPHSSRSISTAKDNARSFINHESFKFMNTLIADAFDLNNPEGEPLIITYKNCGASNMAYGSEVSRWMKERVVKSGYQAYVVQIGPFIEDSKDPHSREEASRRLDELRTELSGGGTLLLALDAKVHSIMYNSGDRVVSRIVNEALDYTEINHSIPKIMALLSSQMAVSWKDEGSTRMSDYIEVQNVVRSEKQAIVTKPVAGPYENLYWFGDLEDIAKGQSALNVIVFGFTTLGPNDYSRFIRDRVVKSLKSISGGAEINIISTVLKANVNMLMLGIELPTNKTIINLYTKYNLNQ